MGWGGVGWCGVVWGGVGWGGVCGVVWCGVGDPVFQLTICSWIGKRVFCQSPTAQSV